MNSVLEIFGGYETDEQICFLPLCHVVERFFSVETQLAVGSTVNFAESTETVFDKSSITPASRRAFVSSSSESVSGSLLIFNARVRIVLNDSRYSKRLTP